MIYLSCLPCSDGNECDVSSKTGEKISPATNHQKHSHAKETCTPFCTCSCCAASPYYSPLFKIAATKVISLLEKYPLYNVAYNTEVYYTIWQPPKLAA
jgi:hypothetical protein